MIIAVTDRKNCKYPFLDQIEKIAKAHPHMLILREKDLSEYEYSILAEKCMGICSKYNVPLCINSFINVASKLEIKNIQMPMPLLRLYSSEFTSFNSVGASVHSLEEATEAAELGADHLIFGHIFKTECKPGIEPRGLKILTEICENIDLPVFAIGGITADNAPLVIKQGAAGICLMSSLMILEDPASVINSIHL